MPVTATVHAPLKLGEEEVASLLALLEDREKAREAANRRRITRYKLDDASPGVAEFIRPGFPTGAYLVYPRNISAGGIGFLHGVFVHSGTTCRVTVAGRDGKARGLQGTVRHCRHISGRVHEVGVQFVERIDPSLFSSEAPAPHDIATTRFIDHLGAVIRSARAGSAPMDLLIMLDEARDHLLAPPAGTDI